MAILRCIEPFAGDDNRVVSAGSLVDSDDPIVKGREHLFEPVETYMSRRAGTTEQATAAPGEVRNVKRPRSAAKS